MKSDITHITIAFRASSLTVKIKWTRGSGRRQSSGLLPTTPIPNGQRESGMTRICGSSPGTGTIIYHIKYQGYRSLEDVISTLSMIGTISPTPGLLAQVNNLPVLHQLRRRMGIISIQRSFLGSRRGRKSRGTTGAREARRQSATSMEWR